MPAPRRKNSLLFGFLSKSAKHKKIGSQDDDQEEILSSYEAESRISYQEETNIYENEENIHANDSDSYFDTAKSPVESREDTEFSAHSLTAKPTTATLAETFSSGTGQDAIHFVDSKDESEVQNSEFFYSQAPHGQENENQHEETEYTEFLNGTREEDDVGTLDYTKESLQLPQYSEDHSESQAARHVRVDDYHDMTYVDGIETEWEETSLGYETCSRTLNTNLEGMNYIPDTSVVHENRASHPYLTADTAFSQYNEDDTGDEPQYHYQDEGYDLYQESFGAEGYYYDDEGQLVGQSYQDGEAHFFDGGDDQNTLANSTIATEGLEPPLLEPTMHVPIIASNFLPSHLQNAASTPFDSYESEQSASSWDDEETRDMSLLDEDDDEEEDGPGDEEANEGSDSDSDSQSDSESDDESCDQRRDRRRPKPKSMMAIINEMKRCSMKGSSVSYDDDDDDIDDVPGVAQISTATTNLTTMTDSFEDSRKSGSQRRKKQKTRRKKTHQHSFDNLFNKVSALGQELLGTDEPNSARKGKKSSRRRDQDPATRIVDSLRDIFSCGHPNHY